MTPQELVAYYVSLLIIQYLNLPRATATIETGVTPALILQNTQHISFLPLPTVGTFILSYNAVDSGVMNFNATAAQVQVALRTIPALANVIVQGSISAGFDVDFTNVLGATLLLVVATNTLFDGVIPTVITITPINAILPVVVQDAFNIDPLLGPVAIGKQLDIIGKYAGVTRTALTVFGNITLNDADFLTLIQFAIVQNTAGSSLGDIEKNMDRFFSGKFLISDFKNMNMSYILDSTLGSREFFAVLVQEKLIPKPMAVGLSVILAPDVTNFFGFFRYATGIPAVPKNKPLNRYASWNFTWRFLSYKDAL